MANESSTTTGNAEAARAQQSKSAELFEKIVFDHMLAVSCVTTQVVAVANTWDIVRRP